MDGKNRKACFYERIFSLTKNVSFKCFFVTTKMRQERSQIFILDFAVIYLLTIESSLLCIHLRNKKNNDLSMARLIFL